jgi:hypothetical protein
MEVLNTIMQWVVAPVAAFVWVLHSKTQVNTTATGTASTAAVGSVTANVETKTTVAGVSATAGIGASVANGKAVATVTGAGAIGGVGSATASTAAATVVTATVTPTVQYSWQAADTDTPGLYTAEF